MASAYPGALDSFATNHVSGEVIQAATDNDQADAINKIEAELGTNPSGAAATVTARFAALPDPYVALETTTRTANYTATLTDAGQVVPMNSASTVTFTVPQSSSVAWATGQIMGVYQVGTGAVSIAQGTGVTITCRGKTAPYLTAGQGAEVWLRRRGATNEWVLTGDVA